MLRAFRAVSKALALGFHLVFFTRTLLVPSHRGIWSQIKGIKGRIEGRWRVHVYEFRVCEFFYIGCRV